MCAGLDPRDPRQPTSRRAKPPPGGHSRSSFARQKKYRFACPVVVSLKENLCSSAGKLPNATNAMVWTSETLRHRSCLRPGTASAPGALYYCNLFVRLCITMIFTFGTRKKLDSVLILSSLTHLEPLLYYRITVLQYYCINVLLCNCIAV